MQVHYHFKWGRLQEGSSLKIKSTRKLSPEAQLRITYSDQTFLPVLIWDSLFPPQYFWQVHLNNICVFTYTHTHKFKCLKQLWLAQGSRWAPPTEVTPAAPPATKPLPFMPSTTTLTSNTSHISLDCTWLFTPYIFACHILPSKDISEWLPLPMTP